MCVQEKQEIEIALVNLEISIKGSKIHFLWRIKQAIFSPPFPEEYTTQELGFCLGFPSTFHWDAMALEAQTLAVTPSKCQDKKKERCCWRSLFCKKTSETRRPKNPSNESLSQSPRPIVLPRLLLLPNQRNLGRKLVPKKAHNKKFVGAAFGMMNEWTPHPQKEPVWASSQQNSLLETRWERFKKQPIHFYLHKSFLETHEWTPPRSFFLAPLPIDAKTKHRIKAHQSPELFGFDENTTNNNNNKQLVTQNQSVTEAVPTSFTPWEPITQNFRHKQKQQEEKKKKKKKKIATKLELQSIKPKRKRERANHHNHHQQQQQQKQQSQHQQNQQQSNNRNKNSSRSSLDDDYGKSFFFFFLFSLC